MDTSEPTSRDAMPVTWGKLWFGFLGGAVAWLLHLLLAYIIAEFGCVSGFARYAFAGVTIVAWMLLVVSVALLAAAIVATLVAYRCDQRLQQEATAAGEHTRDSATWMARAGYILSLLFAFIIAAQSLPILFYLSHC